MRRSPVRLFVQHGPEDSELLHRLDKLDKAHRPEQPAAQGTVFQIIFNDQDAIGRLVRLKPDDPAGGFFNPDFTPVSRIHRNIKGKDRSFP
jgi:hypothetical protein